MMGQQTGLQEQLFYQFRLDDWVPVDHLLRKIDSVLDLSGLRRELAPFYSHTGRPSVDPELISECCWSAIATACDPSGACAKRRTSIWHIDGFADWGARVQFRIIPPFPRTGMAAFARVLCSVACLKRLWRGACGQDWSAAKALRSTPV